MWFLSIFFFFLPHSVFSFLSFISFQHLDPLLPSFLPSLLPCYLLSFSLFPSFLSSLSPLSSTHFLLWSFLSSSFLPDFLPFLISFFFPFYPFSFSPFFFLSLISFFIYIYTYICVCACAYIYILLSFLSFFLTSLFLFSFNTYFHFFFLNFFLFLFLSSNTFFSVSDFVIQFSLHSFFFLPSQVLIFHLNPIGPRRFWAKIKLHRLLKQTQSHYIKFQFFRGFKSNIKGNKVSTSWFSLAICFFLVLPFYFIHFISILVHSTLFVGSGCF